MYTADIPTGHIGLLQINACVWLHSVLAILDHIIVVLNVIRGDTQGLTLTRIDALVVITNVK